MIIFSPAVALMHWAAHTASDKTAAEIQ